MTKKVFFLKGDTIHLRPLEIDDVNDEYHSWINDQENIMFLDSPFPITKESLKSYYSDIKDNKDFIFLAIIESKTNKHIGNAKIGPIHWVHRKTGFGRIIDRKYHSKGYGGQVTKLLIKYIFEDLNLNRIIEHNVVGNFKSLKSNINAGLKNEGLIKSYIYSQGEYRDCHIVGLTKDQYNKNKKNALSK